MSSYESDMPNLTFSKKKYISIAFLAKLGIFFCRKWQLSQLQVREWQVLTCSIRNTGPLQLLIQGVLDSRSISQLIYSRYYTYHFYYHKLYDIYQPFFLKGKYNYQIKEGLLLHNHVSPAIYCLLSIVPSVFSRRHVYKTTTKSNSRGE